MLKLDLYIARHVLGAMAVVLLVLGGLDILFTAVDELGDTDAQYQASEAIIFVLMTFPGHLYELLPMTALIGSLVGLGMLATGNELVVMQASGVAISRIVLAVMKPAVLVMIFGLILGEFIAPAMELRGEVGRSAAMNQSVGLSRFGHWERDQDAFVHFNSLEPDGVLYGLSLLVFDEQHQLTRSIEAEKAVYVRKAPATSTDVQTGVVQRDLQGTNAQSNISLHPRAGRSTGDDGYWLLQVGTDSSFNYGGDRVSSTVVNFAAQSWQLDLTPDLLQVLVIDPDSMAITDLYSYAQRFERQGQDSGRYFLSFWKKALQPLTTAVLVLVAISFIFGPLREATMGSRVFTAICFGLGFTILQRMMHNVSLVYQITPLLAVLLPLVLSSILGIFFFRRTA